MSRPLLDSALPVMIEAGREADMRSMGVVALGFIVAIGGLTAQPHAGGAERGIRVGQVAPEITGGPWVNSAPLTLADLRGRVVFVEFWTYGCYNCKNVIPKLRDWHAKYEREGLTIVGVHSPEFAWEKPYDKVMAATRELGVKYPVVQDNDFAIWRRYGNWAWPTAVIVDKKGVVRHTQIGEGGYGETEDVIRKLLAEP